MINNLLFFFRILTIDMQGSSVVLPPYSTKSITMSDKDNYFKLLYVIISCLSLDKKISLLHQPGFSSETEEVIFRQESEEDTSSLKIRDLIRNSLYESVAREFLIHEHPIFVFNKLTMIIERVKNEQSLRLNDEVTYALLFAMNRLENRTYLRSYVPEAITGWVRSSKHKHKDLVERRMQFETWLNNMQTSLPFDVQKLTQLARERAEFMASLQQPKARLLFKYWLE